MHHQGEKDSAEKEAEDAEILEEFDEVAPIPLIPLMQSSPCVLYGVCVIHVGGYMLGAISG